MNRPLSKRRGLITVLFALPLSCVLTTTARGDVALLRNGRSLTVSDYRMDGDRVVLVMEGGGEIALLNDQIVAIRREPQAPLPAPLAPPAKTTLPAPLEPRTDPGLPMELVPGAVFDREALRDLAGRIARKYQVDEALVRAVIEVESRYDAFAVSPRGAMGLMQLMPETASRFAVRNVFNPVDNV